MYKRDVSILLLSCFALFLSLQHEGTFSFRKAWYHLYDEDSAGAAFSDQSTLPPPVVGDLNGDGQYEVIVATHDYKLQVLKPAPHAGANSGFAQAQVMAEVTLLPRRVTVRAGRQPIALAAGYIDPEPHELVVSMRKQVVVVVTATYQIMCFDHNLKLLWEQSVHEEFPHNAHLSQVAIHISPHKIKQMDRGMVVVGGSMEFGDLAGELKQNVLEEELTHEQEEKQHTQNTMKLHDLDSSERLKGVDTTRHFSYHAFEAETGEARWSHTSEDFHKDLDELADELTPQSSFKLDAEKLAGRHFGEASCRDYREAIMHVLPHAWARQEDTHLEEAYFAKHREGKGAQKDKLAKKGHQAEKGRHAAAVSTSPSKRRSLGLLGLLGYGPKGPPGAAPPHQGSVHHLSPNRTANALVAHLKEGVEVVHLYTGRTICKLHLPEGALHSDLNGDGVVDHVSVFAGSLDADSSLSSDKHKGHLSHCAVELTSGIPPRQQVFTASICDTQHLDLAARLTGQGAAQYDDAPHTLQMPPPVMLPIPRLDGTYSPRRGQHGIIVFLTSMGDITAYDYRGRRLWQLADAVEWDPAAEVPAVPTLKPLSLGVHAVPTAILAAGAKRVDVISEHGNILASMTLAAPPVQPVEVLDFNGDGLNDVVVVTAAGVFGYAQVHHVGGLPLGALMLTLIVAMGIIYYTQLYDAGGKKPRKLRSTEFAD